MINLVHVDEVVWMYGATIWNAQQLRGDSLSSVVGPYPGEVRGIADELLSLLRQLQLSETAGSIVQSIGMDGIADMDDEDKEKALGFLAKTPSQRDKAVARLDGRTAALMILRARYFGLRGAQALDITGSLEGIKGAGYRDAARRSALVAERLRDFPSADRLLGRTSW